MSHAPSAESRTGLVETARAVLDALAGGEPVAVAALAEPAEGGRRLLVRDGATRGTLGDAATDSAARDAARALLDSGFRGARTIELDSGARLYVEVHRSTARLFVVGAGHIAVPLVRAGALLGFPVIVLDDRDEFATPERFPDASEVLGFDFRAPFREAIPRAEDFVVLATRAHRYDFDCLQALLAVDPAPRYIGMVGSRRRVRSAFRALLDEGVSRERLAMIHAPIGVDIGAETPEEIAVSIAAELVAVRREVRAGGSLRDQERVVERYLSEDEETP